MLLPGMGAHMVDCVHPAVLREASSDEKTCRMGRPRRLELGEAAITDHFPGHALREPGALVLFT